MSSTSDISETENQENKVKKRKRGVRNDDKYAQNVVKKKRLSGKEYYSFYSKKNIPAKVVGDDCRLVIMF